MKVYGITTCGSVKSATRFLKAKGLSFDFVDLKKEAVGVARLEAWLQKQPIEILFNTRGTKFRTLKLDKQISEAEKKEWLLKEQLLFKRPIIECDNGDLVVGFDEEYYATLF